MFEKNPIIFEQDGINPGHMMKGSSRACGRLYLELASSWWRHEMEIFSVLLVIYAGNSPVTGEFPGQRPVTRSFDVLFYLPLNKWLSKQWWSWWFEMQVSSLLCHCNVEKCFKNNLCVIPFPASPQPDNNHKRTDGQLMSMIIPYGRASSWNCHSVGLYSRNIIYKWKDIVHQQEPEWLPTWQSDDACGISYK